MEGGITVDTFNKLTIRARLTYTVNVQKYSTWLGHAPDTIIQDLKPIGNIPDPQRVANHAGYLNDYLAELQDSGLKPGAVNNYKSSQNILPRKRHKN